MEHQIKHLNALLEQKEREYKDIIHTMERKILQDKNLMKKEMLQKVNEAVANFRRVADQQMAEVRENERVGTCPFNFSFHAHSLYFPPTRPQKEPFVKIWQSLPS